MGNTCKCMLALVNFALIENLLMEMKFKAKITFIDYMFINCKKINMQLNGWRDYQTCLKKAIKFIWDFQDLIDKDKFVRIRKMD